MEAKREAIEDKAGDKTLEEDASRGRGWWDIC
jgi:hypothetical protein